MESFDFKGIVRTFDHSKLDELDFISLEKFMEIENITKSDLTEMGYKTRDNVTVKGVAYPQVDIFYFIGKNKNGETIVSIRNGGIDHEQTFSFHPQVKAIAQLKLHDITALLGEYYILHRKIPSILNQQGAEEINTEDSYAFHIWIRDSESRKFEWKSSSPEHHLRFYDKDVGVEQYDLVKEILKDPLEINKVYAKLKEALPKLQEINGGI